MKQIIVGHDDAIGAWVMQRTNGRWLPGEGTTIGLTNAEGTEIVAGATFTGYNKANVIGTVAGEGKYWLNREFLWFVFYYIFKQLNCKRATGLIASTNKQSIKFHEHLGFVHEATLKNAHPEGDLLVYVMWPENCRWLKLKEGNNNEQRRRYTNPT